MRLLSRYMAGRRVLRRPGGRKGYEIRDDREVLDFMAEAWKIGDAASVCRAILENAALWGGRDLTLVPGLADAASQHLDCILKTGVRAAMQGL